MSIIATALSKVQYTWETHSDLFLCILNYFREGEDASKSTLSSFDKVIINVWKGKTQLPKTFRKPCL